LLKSVRRISPVGSTSRLVLKEESLTPLGGAETPVRLVPSNSNMKRGALKMPGLVETSTCPFGRSAAGPSATSSWPRPGTTGKSGPAVHWPDPGW
jgi:hypothetical protein